MKSKIRTKWNVHCKELVDKTEWVYAETEEEAKRVIKDNFIDLIPLYAEKQEG